MMRVRARGAMGLLVTTVLAAGLTGCGLLGRGGSRQSQPPAPLPAPTVRVSTAILEGEETKAIARPLAHPHQFTVAEVEALLRSIRYTRYDPIQSTPILPLFDDQVLPRLAPPVRDAFARVSSRQKVAIEVRGPEGATAAELFLFDGDLLAKVETVKGVPHLRQLSGLDPGPSPLNWILVPRDGQRLHSWSGLLGLPERPRNWLVANVASTLAAKPTPPPTPAAARAAQPSTGPALTVEQYRQRQGPARERLQFLKELKDSGLISEQDYIRKQKEILDQL